MNHYRRLFVATLVALPLAAHAYVDPGTGMIAWQGVLAVFGAVIIFFRRGLDLARKLIARFRRK